MQSNNELRTNTSLQSLFPADVVALIFKFFTPKQLAPMRQVSKGCKQEAEKPEFWRNALMRHFLFDEKKAAVASDSYKLFRQKSIEKQNREIIDYFVTHLNGYTTYVSCMYPGCKRNQLFDDVENIVYELSKCSDLDLAITKFKGFIDSKKECLDPFFKRHVRQAINALSEFGIILESENATTHSVKAIA